MTLAASRRKLLQLEAHMWQHIHACQEAAVRQLTDAELEQFHCVTQTHAARLDPLDPQHVPHMVRPAWLRLDEWAVLQRYAHQFLEAYHQHGTQRRRNAYANG
jgi:hypothetical protein